MHTYLEWTAGFAICCTGVLGTYHRQCLLLQNILLPKGKEDQPKETQEFKKHTDDTTK